MATSPANPLTQQYGALKGWQWVAVIGTLGAGLLYLKSRGAAAPADANATAGGYDPTGVPGQSILAPIIIQNGKPSEPLPTPKPPAPKPKPPGPTPKPQPKPTPHYNAKDYSQTVAANSPTGKGMVSVGTITNGKYVGKNTASGAPVYALINTAYGPRTSFVQSWQASKLPNGTKIYTLAQFKDLFK